MSPRPTAVSDRPLSRRRFLTGSLGAGLAMRTTGSLLSTGIARAASPTPQTLRDKVAQLFVISFQGVTAGRDILTLLESYAFGGVILYSGNCHSAEQVHTLTTELQAMARFPLLVCTDQEGGRVVRIHDGAPQLPWEATYGRIGSHNLVYHDATASARALRALGLTMNLAPVVDVLDNPKSPIGWRSYGSDPALAAKLSVAAVRGYQHHGMAATAKHFVGLGHTSIDSHRSLPTVTVPMSKLAQTDLVPFRAAIAAGVSTVMVAHVALPAIDPVYRPASLSPVMIEGVLRGQLGFRGVVMTDSLIMGALPAGHEAEAAERALTAGADILLIAGERPIPVALIEESVARVTAGIAAGRIPESRLDTALARIAALKQRYPAFQPGQ